MNDIAAMFADPAALYRILDLTRRLAAPCELFDLLQQVIDCARVVLSADRGTVFLYDKEKRELYSIVAHGAQGIRFSVDRGIAGACARERVVINIPDCYADPRFNQDVDKRTGYRTRCMITLPLIGLEDELVGVLQLLNSNKPCFDASDERLADVLASQAAVAIQRSLLIDIRMEKLKQDRDLALAREIQQAVLPTKLPRVPGYDLACFAKPADETGGDIFDVIPIRSAVSNAPAPEASSLIATPGADTPEAGLVFLLADATGHGIGPAISVTQVRAMLRLGLRLGGGLDDMAKQINDQLVADLNSSRFVTAFLGMLDIHTHAMRYHSAGQGPLLHFHAENGQYDWLDASTLPLGVMEDAPMDAVSPIQMANGDYFVLLTDGFYEYQNHAGKMFGKEGVAAALNRSHRDGASAALDALLADLSAFADGAPQMDDLTAIVIRRV